MNSGVLCDVNEDGFLELVLGTHIGDLYVYKFLERGEVVMSLDWTL